MGYSLNNVFLFVKHLSYTQSTKPDSPISHDIDITRLDIPKTHILTHLPKYLYCLYKIVVELLYKNI